MAVPITVNMLDSPSKSARRASHWHKPNARFARGSGATRPPKSYTIVPFYSRLGVAENSVVASLNQKRTVRNLAIAQLTAWTRSIEGYARKGGETIAVGFFPERCKHGCMAT